MEILESYNIININMYVFVTFEHFKNMQVIIRKYINKFDELVWFLVQLPEPNVMVQFAL